MRNRLINNILISIVYANKAPICSMNTRQQLQSPVDIAGMRTAAARTTQLLRTMANEDRLLLLCQLSHGECCVSDLEELLDIRQPTLSQQLAVLRNEELVSTRREGKHIHYRITDERVLALLRSLYDLFCNDQRMSSC